MWDNCNNVSDSKVSVFYSPISHRLILKDYNYGCKSHWRLMNMTFLCEFVCVCVCSVLGAFVVGTLN